jgi:hypothetical protein
MQKVTSIILDGGRGGYQVPAKTHRNKTRIPAINVWKWLWRLYSESGSKAWLPKTLSWITLLSALFGSYKIKSGTVIYMESYLHADNGVDEEEHGNQETDVWQSLERSFRYTQ